MTSPKLASDTRHGRMYTLGDEVFVSVTNVINVLDKPFLAAGARKVVAELAIDEMPKYLELAWKDRTYAKKVLKQNAKAAWDTTAALGTAVHAEIEAWTAGRPASLRELVPMPAEVQPFFDQWLKFTVDYKPVQILQSEVSVFSRLHRYAGTIDLLAVINNECWLIDVKTGKEVHADSNALQLTALKWAEFMVVDNVEVPLPEIAHTAVLHIRPDRYQLVEMASGIDVFTSFLAVKAAWEWKNVISETVIIEGAPHV